MRTHSDSEGFQEYDTGSKKECLLCGAAYSIVCRMFEIIKSFTAILTTPIALKFSKLTFLLGCVLYCTFALCVMKE